MSIRTQAAIKFKVQQKQKIPIEILHSNLLLTV